MKLRVVTPVIAALAMTTINSYAFTDSPTRPLSDTTKKDSVKFTLYNDLPLKPSRAISFTTNEGSWMSVDVHPDGKTLVFDLMGDIYTLPITGGRATALTTGLAFDTRPRYSPDGKKLLFTSDRSGSENLWYIDFAKKDTVQVTKDRDQNYPSATWTPDGNFIIAARGRLDIKLWMLHKDAGSGVQLMDAPNIKTIDPAISPDGRYIYFSQREGFWNYNAQMPQYGIGVYDRENAKTKTVAARYGSAFTPVLSKDGKWMAYGTRYEDKTGLILRNLETGDEKWLAYPVQRDDQESMATMGVLPGMSFTPDSKNLIASYGGKFYRLPVDGSKPVEIPFTVDVKLEFGPRLEFKYPVSDTSHAIVTQIRDAVPSPDGKKLAFTALNRLYVMDYPKGKPARVTNNEFTEAQPAWSPDGNSLAFITWSPNGGHLYKVALNTKGKPTPQQLTKSYALYSYPVWSPKGDRIVFIQGKLRAYKSSIGPAANTSENQLCWIPAAGGDISVIDNASQRANPHFIKGSDRIYLNENNNLVSIRWDGTDQKTHATITGITTFGISNPYANGHDHSLEPSRYCMLSEKTAQAMELQLPTPANQITLSPDGNRAIAQVNNDIYVLVIPRTGKPAVISLADPNSSNFPARKLTEIGGEFASWEADGKKVHWSLGNAHFVYDVDSAQAFDDSVRIAKKEEARKKADSIANAPKDTAVKKAAPSMITTAGSYASPDTLSPKANSLLKRQDSIPKPEPKYKSEETQIVIYYQRDIPKGTILLKDGRILTMNNDEILEEGDVLIVNNRIKQVGKNISAPAGAKVIDVKGKTIVPGFVDTHAHMWNQFGIQKNQSWIYAANLAHGVTTTRDPQTGTTDVLTYGDMVDAGKMIGPRIYSTGPGVGFWRYNVRDSAHASDILKQYSKYFSTKYIKMYMTGPRNVREWIIKACRDQGLTPTTEGGLNYKTNMTNLLDGYPGHEHSIPVYPLYNDVIKAIAESKMTVTPTLLVAYGGPWAENYFFETEEPYKNKKMQHFMPYDELAQKTRRVQGWFMKEEHVFPKHAQTIKKLVENGGMAGIGSHGEFQGLGYHWEMWALQSGGLKNYDVLKVATITGAQALGLDGDVGSIAAGKLADIVIMDKNPLENIRNTNTVSMVIKNGRVYNGDTLDEIYPQQRKLETSEWDYDGPANSTGLEN